MLDKMSLDIVAVCVRGPMHHQVTMEVIKAGPKAIFLEKPPTCSLQEMDDLIKSAGAKQIPITVSYSRHWSPHVMRLQELVQQEQLIGDVHTVIGYVGGTFLSFASHTTDLICQFAGYNPKSVMAQGHYRPDETVPAGYEGEPVVEGVLKASMWARTGLTGVSAVRCWELRAWSEQACICRLSPVMRIKHLLIYLNTACPKTAVFSPSPTVRSPATWMEGQYHIVPTIILKSSMKSASLP